MENLEALLAQKAALDQRIIDAQRQQRSDAINKVKALMSEHGLTLADIGRTAVSSRKPTRKVAPKYRHPQSGETWSGRGLQPNWLKSALAGGAQLTDFKI